MMLHMLQDLSDAGQCVATGRGAAEHYFATSLAEISQSQRLRQVGDRTEFETAL